MDHYLAEIRRDLRGLKVANQVYGLRVRYSSLELRRLRRAFEQAYPFQSRLGKDITFTTAENILSNRVAIGVPSYSAPVIESAQRRFGSRALCFEKGGRAFPT